MSCDNRGCGYSRWNLVPVEVNDLICCWFHWIYSFTFCSVNVYLKHPLVYKHFSREDKLWLWNKSSWNCLLSFVTAVVFGFIPKMKSVQFLFLIFFEEYVLSAAYWPLSSWILLWWAFWYIWPYYCIIKGYCVLDIFFEEMPCKAKYNVSSSLSYISSFLLAALQSCKLAENFNLN